MSEGPPKENVSRRAALKIIAGSAGAAINLPVLQGSTAARPAHLCRVAVPAAQAATSAPKFFTAQEIQTLAALSETVRELRRAPGRELARHPLRVERRGQGKSGERKRQAQGAETVQSDLR